MQVLDSYLKMPFASAQMRVGLFGGSFNPAHEGHLLVAETALKRLGLESLWWMLTPGNPLKKHIALAPLQERLQQSARLIKNPKIFLTAFEEKIQSYFFEQTLCYILNHYPRTKFVLVLGADSLIYFHRWQRWRFIVENIPIAVIDRPKAREHVIASPFFYCYKSFWLPEGQAKLLPLCKPPVWTYLTGPLCAQSSTAIRARQAAHSSVL